jgi:hypothetical protein
MGIAGINSRSAATAKLARVRRGDASSTTSQIQRLHSLQRPPLLRRWKHAASFGKRCKSTTPTCLRPLKGRSREAQQARRHGAGRESHDPREVWERCCTHGKMQSLAASKFPGCASSDASYPNFRASHMPAADNQLSPPQLFYAGAVSLNGPGTCM